MPALQSHCTRGSLGDSGWGCGSGLGIAGEWRRAALQPLQLRSLQLSAHGLSSCGRARACRPRPYRRPLAGLARARHFEPAAASASLAVHPGGLGSWGLLLLERVGRSRERARAEDLCLPNERALNALLTLHPLVHATQAGAAPGTTGGPGSAVPPAGPPTMTGVTQGMGNMNMGGPPGPAPPTMMAPPPGVPSAFGDSGMPPPPGPGGAVPGAPNTMPPEPVHIDPDALCDPKFIRISVGKVS